ncbi:MAG: maleylpyruvate isomerase family mycothiol-dependent enzyme [Aquihabitans sp.]
MADRTFDFDQVRTAFRYASQWWRSIVGAVPDEQWERPALGEWSVRELVAHTSRAYRTIPEYIGGDVKDPTPIATAAEYFRTVLAEDTPHVHIADRGRREASLETDWVTATDRLANEVVKLIDSLPADKDMHLFVGVMPLDQYLVTRVTELVVHGLDLAAAIDMQTEPPVEASRMVADLFLDLAQPRDLSSIIGLLSGRTSSRPLTNVLD